MAEWRLVIHCPAYNVEKSVAGLVERTAMQRRPLAGSGVSLAKMIVVNDGSTDGTGAILHRLEKKHRFLCIVEKRQNKGPASAVFSGMQAAAAIIRKQHLPRNRTIVVRMDSDLEHQPEDIRKIIGPIISGEARVCVGYLQPDLRLGLPAWLFGYAVGLAESREFLGLQIPQFAPGFNAVRADLFSSLLPQAKRAASLFRMETGKDLLTVDFVYLALARRAGQAIAARRLLPVEDGRVKGMPVSKAASYLRYHRLTSSFLRSRLFAGRK